MSFHTITTHHFVKSEDLNHHGTLFAGRTAEWFVEAGLMSAAVYIPADNIVCVKIHGMEFCRPIRLGEVARFDSAVVYAGRTSLISYIQVSVNDVKILGGFITFVNVDENGASQAHSVVIKPDTEEEKILQEQARDLPKHKQDYKCFPSPI